MKKRYKTPAMKIERFLADINVAATACVSKVVATEAIPIDCVANGSESIFNSNLSCGLLASNLTTTEYNDTVYVIWYTTSKNTNVKDKDAADLIKAILENAGYSNDNVSGQYHAAEFESIDQYFTNSY